MIRIERGKEVSPGIWEYAIPSLSLCGRSRQPLLDGCRQISRALGPTAMHARLFREGRYTADISCPVEAGAGLTIEETPSGPRFRKFKEFAGLAAE